MPRSAPPRAAWKATSRIALHGGEFYLDADVTLRENLGARLDKYLIADDAVFEDVSDLWSLSHVFGATPPHAPQIGFVIANARFGLPGHDVWIADCGAVVVGDTVEVAVLETLRLEARDSPLGRGANREHAPARGRPRDARRYQLHQGLLRRPGDDRAAEKRGPCQPHARRAEIRVGENSRARRETHGGDKEAGVVTSSGRSPRLKTGIALGYVHYQLAAEGTVFHADGLNLTVIAPLSKDSQP